ncbi:hypothetical protein ACVWZV_001440 [Bradyrhizobium sp. GM5.1]
MRHVVQGGVEPPSLRFQPLLRLPILTADLANDQEQDQRNHGRRKRGGGDHETGLLPPVGQRRARGVGRDDDQREMRKRGAGAEALVAVDRAPDAQGVPATFGQHLAHQRRVLEVPADQLFDMRVARQHLAIAVEQRDRRALRKRNGCEIVHW